MKSSENGVPATNWSLARIAGLCVGLGVGVACLCTGLFNTGLFNTGPFNTGPFNTGPLNSGPLNSEMFKDGQVDAESLEASGEGGLAQALTPNAASFGGRDGELSRARPVRNVPRDFSVVFAAAASPGESDVAGLMADCNFDGVIDGRDVEEFVETIDGAIDQARRTGFGGFSPRYDLNDDGRLDERDLELYFDAFGFGEHGPRFKGVHLVKC